MRNEIELGRAVRGARKNLGWTQAALAQRAQVSRAYVIALESGAPRVELGRALRVIRSLGAGVALVPNADPGYDDGLTQLLERDH